MPHILDPNSSSSEYGLDGRKEVLGDLGMAPDYGYRYPVRMNLKPGSRAHERLRQRIMRRAQDARMHISRRQRDWEEIDKSLKCYYHKPKPGSALDTNEDGTENRIIIPVSHAVMQTVLTYFTSAFLQQPIFKYEGSGPEDVVKGLMLTEIIQKHNRHFANALSFHTAWRDMIAYGIGAASPVWRREYGQKIEMEPMGMLDPIRRIFNITGSRKKITEYEVLFEGNALVNIDPYRLLPDPSVSAHEVQDGEFFGWGDSDTYQGLLVAEADASSGYFNTRYLRHLASGTSSLWPDRDRTGAKNTGNTRQSRVDLIWMYIDLIPKEWELGRSEDPEKWLFCLAADKVVVKAQPIGLAHNKFPVAVGAPEYDGYSITPTSLLEIHEELQHLIDFLYTSHMANVKRVVNDNLVVDPSLVNIYDVLDNRPGKVIRLRRKAWAKGGIDEAIKQLDVKDVTQGNVEDALLLQNLVHELSGATQNLMGGFARRTSRISAAEAQSARASGLSRLERPARIVSLQFMLPIARMMASHTQQFMSMDTYVKTTGDLERRLIEEYGVVPTNGRLQVSPMDLLMHYDVEPHDGTIPGQEDGELWMMLFQTLGQNPELAQAFDVVRIFKHIARQLGAKDVDDFVRRKPIVMPDEQVMQEVDRGNAVPVGGDGVF